MQQVVLPIKDSNVLKEVQDTLLNNFKAGRRNYTVFQVGKATLLRVSDVMRLKQTDIFNPDGSIKQNAFIHDRKTGKPNRGPERLVGICIDKGYKFPLNQCFKAYLFFIFNSLKCLGIDNKSNLYSPRKVICSQLIGDTCFIYLVTSGSILTR